MAPSLFYFRMSKIFTIHLALWGQGTWHEFGKNFSGSNEHNTACTMLQINEKSILRKEGKTTTMTSATKTSEAPQSFQQKGWKK